MDSHNIDSLTTEALENQGEFHASKPRSRPMETHGHQPGLKTDSTQTFSVETLPAKSAPPESTFAPQNAQTGDGLNTSMDPTEGMVGATSRGVHAGIGKPGHGMTSKEMHHDGQPGRKKQGLGLEKYGAGGELGDGRQRERTD